MGEHFHATFIVGIKEDDIIKFYEFSHAVQYIFIKKYQQKPKNTETRIAYNNYYNVFIGMLHNVPNFYRKS